jgi:putative transposase
LIAKKTIKAKVLELRRGKESLLIKEYQNWQRYIHGDRSAELYSATKQQAEKFIRRLQKQNGGTLKDKEYPMILRNDVYRADTKLTQYWIKIPIHGVRGGINVPVGVSSPIPDGAETKEAKLIRRDGDWFIYMTIEKEVEESPPKNIIGVDLGIRHLAVTVNSSNPKPKFHGKELGAVQAHYYNLRKTLQKKNAHGTVKKVGNHCRRVTDAILHKVSKDIVTEAANTKAAIAIGNLAGIRNHGGGKAFNRKLNSWPFHRLEQFVKYKAEWTGVKVMEVPEAYTSQVCHNCGSKGLRVGGRFQCHSCGREYNADYNGAYNIMKRGIGHALSQGLLLTQPVNPIG